MLGAVALATAACAPAAEGGRQPGNGGPPRVVPAQAPATEESSAREAPAGPAEAPAPVEHLHVFDDGSSAIVPPPAATPPPVPVLPAQGPDDQSAMATLAYFYEARHYAFATGEVAPVAAVSADSCGTCAEVVSGAASLAAKGYDVRGGEATVSDAVAGADAGSPGDRNARVVEAILVAEPQFAFQENRMVLAEPTGVYAVRAALRYDGQGWRVTGIRAERAG